MFFVGVALAFFLLHLFLFSFYRKEAGNLYLAIAALGFAVFMGVNTLDASGFSAAAVRAARVLGVAGVSTMIVGFIRFGHYFLDRKSPKVMSFFVVAAVVAVGVTAITGDTLTPQIFALLSLVELLRGLFWGLRHPPGPRSWVVGIGFLAILASAGTETLAGFGVLPTSLLGIYKYGMLVMFAAVSVYLSWRFADTRVDLERRLVQVETLTEQAVEQERQSQRRNLERQLLEQDHERQKRELEAARDLQLAMLPAKPPSLPDLEIHFAMKTASEVGGDYYDYHQNADGSLTLAIGDATGHGLDAGLVVATTKGLFHASAGAPTLELALARITEGLEGLSLKRRHMSLLLLRWAGGELEAISAGMPPVFVHRSHSGVVDEWLAGAPPLTALSEHEYRSGKLRFDAGDTLLACSDGLPERIDPSDEPFGYERLRRVLGEEGSAGLSEVRDRLFAAAERWADARPRQDDETLMLLRRLPRG